MVYRTTINKGYLYQFNPENIDYLTKDKKNEFQQRNLKTDFLINIIHELMLKTHKELNAITIVISHDIEVFKYATTVAMLHSGKIVAQEKAKNIWESKNPYIYQFIRGLSDGPIEQVGFKK